MKSLDKVAKAVAGLVASGYAALQLAMLTGSEAGNKVTTNEWICVAGAALVTATAVWATTNAPTDTP